MWNIRKPILIVFLAFYLYEMLEELAERAESSTAESALEPTVNSTQSLKLGVYQEPSDSDDGFGECSDDAVAGKDEWSDELIDGETGYVFESAEVDVSKRSQVQFRAVPDFSANMESYARALTAAQLNLTPAVHKLPWETSLPLMRTVPGPFDRLSNMFQRPNLLATSVWIGESVVEAEIREIRKMTVFPAAVKRLRDLRPLEAEDALRAKALSRWTFIISVCPEASSTGRALIRMIGHLKTNDSLNKIIEDLTAKRAPSTVLKRAGSMMKFLAYCKSRGMVALPLNEESCIDYCRAIESDQGAAATSILTFRQALAFAGGVLQFDKGVELSKHPRLAGMEHKKLLGKRVLKQAATYRVFEIKLLMQVVVVDKCDDLRKVFCGHVLFCIFARARWHDHQHITELEWDVVDEGEYGGFVQGNTRRTKTGITAQQRTRFMPLTAVLWNFLGDETGLWWESWMDARVRLGLQAGPDKPFLPAPKISGGFCQRALSAGEATAWIREILQELNHENPAVSAHGCKATTLSWLAKHGEDPEVRLMLGYHRGNTSDSMLHYSRDAMSGPLAILNRVIKKIVRQEFFPDNNRAAYFNAIKSKASASGAGRLVSRDELRSTAVRGARGEPPPANPVTGEVEDFWLLDSEVREAGEDSPAKRSRKQEQEVVPDQPALEAEAPGSKELEAVSEDEDSSDASTDTSVDEEWVARAVSDASPEPSEGGPGGWLHSRLGTLHKAHVSDPNKLACGRVISHAYDFVSHCAFKWSECSTCFQKSAR